LDVARQKSGRCKGRVLAALLMVLWLAQSPDAMALKNLVTAPLAVSDVQNVIARAVTQAVHNNQAVTVAISDREGNVLGVFTMNGAPMNATDVDQVNQLQPPDGTLASTTAIEKARTAAFLSSDQNAFSTRTGFFITRDHFPPGVLNQPPGPLFGLPFSSLPCGDVQLHGNGITGQSGGI